MKRIKMVMQMKQTECGLCVAQMILNYYGAMVQLSDLNKLVEVGRDGLSLKRMKELLEYYGIETSLYKTCSDDMYKYREFTPFIALSKEGHYVVVEKIQKNLIKIVDPAVGKRAMTYEEYRDIFMDRIFSAIPGENFTPIKKKKKSNIFIKGICANKKAFIGMFAIVLMVYVMMFSVPMLSKKVLNLILSQNIEKSSLTMWSEIILALFAVYMLLLFVKAKADVKLSIILDKYLSNEVIDKLFKNDIKFFIQRTSADIQYRFSLLRGVKSLMNSIVVTTVLDAGSLVVILGYVLTVAPRYAILLTLFSIVVLGMKFILREKVILYKNEETAADSKLQVLQNDMFRSITDVKVLGVQSEKKQQWKKSFDEYIGKHKKYETLMAKYRSVLSALNMFVPIFVVVFGAWYVQKTNDISEIAVVVSLQTILSLYLTSLLSISDMVDNLYLIRAYMVRIEDIMEQEDEKRGKRNIEVRGNIRLENLSFKYPGDERYALDNINLEIHQGEKIAFTGCTGSGKSTLLNVLVGLFKDYEGNMIIEGINAKEISEESIHSNISVVPQNSLLFNGTLKDNLDITGKHTEEEIYNALDIVALGDFVRKLPMKLNTVIAENGFNFSGGQRQRIALARAIINNGKIICLDEATSSLDNVTESKIVDYFEQNNSTQVIVAHRLSTIKDADCIYVMKDGKIVEHGRHYELMELNGEYRKLYDKERRNEVFSCAG